MSVISRPVATWFKRSAIVLASVAALSACQAPGAPSANAAGQGAAVTVPAPTVRQEVANGLYELVYDPASKSLFVAATPVFAKGEPGLVHRVDPQSLAIQQSLQIDRRAFALGLNSKTNTLFVGNTLDGSITVLDLATNTVKRVIQLGKLNDKGDAAHTRKVIVDEAADRLYVTNPSEQGTVWMVDAKTGEITATFEKLGKWSTGATFDPSTRRLYVGHGGADEIAVIDVDAAKVVTRFTTGETDKHYFINLSVDPKTQRLFAADSNANELFVFDARTGAILKRVPVGLGALDVVFNPQRDEVYVTSRGVTRSEPSGSGQIAVIDANTYAVKRTLDVPVHPNSLALSEDGQTLFATVKVPRGDKHPAYKKDAKDSVVRIDLR